jgi:hypothetical protein
MSYNKIKNNISSGNDVQEFEVIGGGTNDGVFGQGNVYTYNNFGLEATNFIEWVSGTFISTYSVFDDSVGSATNSITVDPLFTNAGGNVALNYKPKASGLDRAGTYINATIHARDYSNISVPDPPDIGAFQFSLGYENKFSKFPDWWKFPRR